MDKENYVTYLGFLKDTNNPPIYFIASSFSWKQPTVIHKTANDYWIVAQDRKRGTSDTVYYLKKTTTKILSKVALPLKSVQLFQI